jgi:hypothetical protein
LCFWAYTYEFLDSRDHLLYSPIFRMIPRIIFFLLAPSLIPLSFSGCASSANSTYRDYTLAVGAAYPREAELAQTRVNSYLAHLSPREKERVAQNEYLAVVATEVPIGEVPGLSARAVNLGLTGTTGAYTDRASMMTKFIMIFDAKTGQSVSNEGYISLQTPPLGQLGVFGGYTALYIGHGK